LSVAVERGPRARPEPVMNPVVPPARGQQCLPTLELEQLAALGRSVPHVDGCESCRAYVEALKEQSAAYVKARPFELFEKKLARKTPQRRWWPFWAVPLLAATTAAVVIALPDTTGIRDKGASPFSVLLHRAGGATKVSDDT